MAVDDGLGELVQAVLLVLVVPVSVGRLHKEVVCLLDHRRIPDDELRRTADVAGEDDTVGLAVLRDHELDHRRAEDMARIAEGRRDPLSGGKGLVVIHGREQRKGGPGVLFGIKRCGALFPFSEAFAAPPLRLDLLNVGAVQEHDLKEITGRPRHVHLSVKPLLHQPREESGMVHVGVRHQDELDFPRIVNVDIPVAPFDLVVALVHPAVDGETPSRRFDDETGAGHRPCRTEKFDLHGHLMVGVRKRIVILI